MSTVFFVHVLYLIRRVIRDGGRGLPAPAVRFLNTIWWLFLVSWMLYPGGYLIPLLMDLVTGVVGRQITYTVSDIRLQSDLRCSTHTGSSDSRSGGRLRARVRCAVGGCR